ncbi:unnamed protein product [Fraxinus pennsylvanica]|uniref:Uncharacterized protein n=1 Tax=Fraxinus pennsylvanica TaxID=56036 RepID=A0AAD1YVM1_9LAMI|nr:unnamed protein product [Fraxinus pennsylvanica]
MIVAGGTHGLFVLESNFPIGDKVMAIGDGENDVEMLDLASLGVALSNGSEKAKAAANVIGISNDEDGVADAIYRLQELTKLPKRHTQAFQAFALFIHELDSNFLHGLRDRPYEHNAHLDFH